MEVNPSMLQKYLNAYTDYVNDPFINIDETCKKYGFHKTSFYRALKKEGLSLPIKQFSTTCNKERLDEAVKLYRQGKSIKKIVEELHMGEKTLSKYLHYIREDIREYHIPTKGLTVNQDYFEEILSEHQAYWYGFIMADGSVIATKEYGYRLSIELNEIDRNHLEKFKTDIGSNHLIHTRKNKPMVFIAINNKKLVSDLQKIGCTQNKTNIGWIAFDKIDTKYWKDILRGFLDGDGFIDKKRYRIIYTIKQESVAKSVVNAFLKLNIVAKSMQDKSYYRVTIEQKENFYNALHILYDAATIYLNRKYETYLSRINNMPSLMETSKQAERN
jgi:DNA-binding transcriptional regulator WhiA